MRGHIFLDFDEFTAVGVAIDRSYICVPSLITEATAVLLTTLLVGIGW